MVTYKEIGTAIQNVCAALWAAALWTILIGRLATGDTSLFEHFTNWSWLIRCLQRSGLYLAWTYEKMGNPKPLVLWSAYSFIPVTSLGMFVMVVFSAVLVKNPDILLSFSEVAGESVALGHVFLGDIILHVVPVIDDLIHMLVMRDYLIYAFSHTFIRNRWTWWAVLTFSPLIVILGYLPLDPYAVYGVSMSQLHPALMAFYVLSVLVSYGGMWAFYFIFVTAELSHRDDDVHGLHSLFASRRQSTEERRHTNLIDMFEGLETDHFSYSHEKGAFGR